MNNLIIFCNRAALHLYRIGTVRTIQLVRCLLIIFGTLFLRWQMCLDRWERWQLQYSLKHFIFKHVPTTFISMPYEKHVLTVLLCHMHQPAVTISAFLFHPLLILHISYLVSCMSKKIIIKNSTRSERDVLWLTLY